MAGLETRTDLLWKYVGQKRWDVLVAWYLMASVAYYHWDEKFLEDSDYDMLCYDLYKNLGGINHKHKHLLDPDALLAGTAYHLKYEDYPLITKVTAWSLLHPKDPTGRTMPGGRPDLAA